MTTSVPLSVLTHLEMGSRVPLDSARSFLIWLGSCPHTALLSFRSWPVLLLPSNLMTLLWASSNSFCNSLFPFLRQRGSSVGMEHILWWSVAYAEEQGLVRDLFWNWLPKNVPYCTPHCGFPCFTVVSWDVFQVQKDFGFNARMQWNW